MTSTRPLVLHVIPTLGRGGAERQLVAVAAAQGACRHVVCQLGGPDDLAQPLRDAGVEVIDLGLRGRRPWLRAAGPLRRVLDTHRPDVVQSWLLDAAVPVFLARATGFRVPWVETFHNTDYEPDVVRAAGLPLAKVAVLRFVDAAMLRLARVQPVGVTRAVARSVERQLRLRTGSVTVIPNSVDERALAVDRGGGHERRRELGIPESEIVFLNIGRLDPQKGQLDLVRAFARLPGTPHLVVVGTGRLAGDLRRAASDLGVADRTHLVGSRGDVGAWLAMADVFVFPSLYEGFGIALAEAMHEGLPCIATDIPAVVEVLDGTGVLVPPTSVDALADAMQRLADSPDERRRLGDSAATMARARFTTAAVVAQWDALHARLVSR